jgi:hypothetical protein
MWNLLRKAWDALTSMRDAKGVLGKKWYRSKTLWANIMAVVVVLAQDYLGYTIDTEMAVQILGFVNVVLRLITTEPVGFLDP